MVITGNLGRLFDNRTHRFKDRFGDRRQLTIWLSVVITGDLGPLFDNRTHCFKDRLGNNGCRPVIWLSIVITGGFRLSTVHIHWQAKSTAGFR